MYAVVSSIWPSAVTAKLFLTRNLGPGVTIITILRTVFSDNYPRGQAFHQILFSEERICRPSSPDILKSR